MPLDLKLYLRRYHLEGPPALVHMVKKEREGGDQFKLGLITCIGL